MSIPAQSGDRATEPPVKVIKLARLKPVDREFLPAALEILETPPSPVRMWLLLGICGLVVATLSWAVIGRFDIVAVAQGKFQSIGRTKVVQPLETGKVRAILVENGQHVREGQAIVELDDSEVHAEETGLIAAVAASRGEALRRLAAIEAAKSGSFVPPAIDWPAAVPANIRAREERVLSGDLEALSGTATSLAAQRRQKEAEGARLIAMIESQEKILMIGQNREELRARLEKMDLGSKLLRFDAQEQLQQQRTSLAQQQGQLAEARAAMEVLQREIAKAVSTFVADNATKLAEAERRAEEDDQRLAKAQARSSHMVLRAPVSGVVQALSITSAGQVVMPGEEVMRIVPDDAGFEIECYLPNKDIGFVHAGQEAVVKIEAFPFTRYGALNARVVRVGTDAVPEPDILQKESDPAKAPRSSFLGGTQRTQNLFFPVVLTADPLNSGKFDLERIASGMAVTVEIKTGERRIIDYLFSPLVELSSRALKER
jgi:hemolysin D